MKISVYRDLLNNVYKSRVATSDFSERDRQLMTDFSEPTINVGGEYHGTRPDELGDIDLSVGYDWTSDNESFILTVNDEDAVELEMTTDCDTLAEIVTVLNGKLATASLNTLAEFYEEGDFIGIRTLAYGSNQQLVLAVGTGGTGTLLGTLGLDAGTYTGTGAPEYTLEDSYRRVMTESPFAQAFDVRDEEFTGAARIKADLWTSTIVTSIKTAMDTLRSNSDTYSGETVETY